MGKKSRIKKEQSKKKQASKKVNKVNKVREVIPASLQGSTYTPPAVVKSTGNILDAQTQHIRNDIVRIALLMLIIVIILVGAVLLNEKTTYLIQAGQKLGGFLKL